MYRLDGTACFHAVDGAVQDVQLGGGMAYATMTTGGKQQLAVDLASGHVMNAVSSPNILLVG